MNTKTLVLTVVLACIIVAPLAVAAPEGPRGGRGEGPARGGFAGGQAAFGRGGDLGQMLLGRMADELNLSEAQRESIRNIVTDSRTATQENRQAVQEAMQALNDAADKGDEAAIKAAGKTAGDALIKQALQRAEVSKKVKAVLNSEQQAKLDQMQTQMRERMQEMRQQRREGQGQGQGARVKARAKEAPEAAALTMPMIKPASE